MRGGVQGAPLLLAGWWSASLRMPPQVRRKPAAVLCDHAGESWPVSEPVGQRQWRTQMSGNLHDQSIEPSEIERDERTRLLAFSIWEEEGRPEGRADIHWQMAAAIVEAQIAVAQMRDPDWLKRGLEALAANRTTAEPADIARAPLVQRAAA